MTNKSTKRALLSSVVALFLCFSMLLGTTYAWFTDSATSANNIIKSGNLKINLEYWDGSAWKNVEGASDILTGDLWEPGYVDVAYLRVSNAGSLALKYQLGVNIVTETAGVNLAGDTYKLSDYIYFDVKEGINGEEAPLDRDGAMKIATSTTKISEGYSKAGELLANDPNGEVEYVYLAMIVYMPQNVGNAANHDGNTIPQIDLGVNVIATQMAAEWDSFGPDYDEDAVYADAFVSTAADLQTAITDAEDGDVIALMGDIDLTGATTFSARAAAVTNYISIPAGTDVTINMNGYDIIGASVQDKGNQYAIQVKGSLTLAGEGTVSIIHTGADMGWNNLTAAISVEGGSLTLGEGVVVVHNGGSAMAYAVDANSTLGTTTVNVNGATLYSSYIGIRLFNNHKTQKVTVNFNNGAINGGRLEIWAQNPSAAAVDANAIVNIAEDYNVILTTQDADSFYGRMYEFKDTTTVAGSNEDLSNALGNAETKEIYLVDGEYSLPSLSGKEGITIIGTNDTVIGGEDASSGFYYSNFGKDTTIKNVTFAGSSNGVRWSYAQGGTSTFENCTFAGDSTYGFHIDSSNGATFIFNNCTFSGFNAFAGDLEKVIFNNCTFLHNGNYGHTNIHSVAEFNNCTFGDKASVGPAKTTAKLYFNGVEESYHHEYIGSAESLFAFAESVNEGGDSWKGQKVILVDDINLGSAVWTPIGQTGATEFRGIFDGNNHTIYNLNVDNSAYTDEHTSSGLFGWAESGVTIQNVKVNGAKIVGNHNVAVIVGYTYSAKITNCHVTNAEIVCNHANGDACGDKCGLIVGYAGDESRITGCTATDSTVTAGRDGGQLIGAGYNVSVSGCSATNVTVTAGKDCPDEKNINNAVIGRVLG